MLVASAATIMRLSFELALKHRRQRYFQSFADLEQARRAYPVNSRSRCSQTLRRSLLNRQGPIPLIDDGREIAGQRSLVP
jgi:hypothetical protein